MPPWHAPLLVCDLVFFAVFQKLTFLEGRPRLHLLGRGLFEAVAGQPAEFVIQAMDPDTGAPAYRGGHRFCAVLESRELHYDLDVVDNDDGTFSAKYIPTRVGTYELSVMLDDYDIQGSPFNPTVRPAPVSAPHCVADGAGLFCAIVGVINQFTVHPRNSFNQIVVASGVPFVACARAPIVLCSPDGTPASDQFNHLLKDNGDGSYSCFYIVQLSAEDRRRLGQVGFSLCKRTKEERSK